MRVREDHETNRINSIRESSINKQDNLNEGGVTLNEQDKFNKREHH